MTNPPVFVHIQKAARHLLHLSTGFRLPTNSLDLPTLYSPLPRAISTSRAKMANIHTPIPQLKLNDDTSIPMARTSSQRYKHKLILDTAWLWQ